MFNFFRRQPQKTYVVVARYHTGHWFRQFEIAAPSRYDASRKFDQSEDGQHWYRSNGAAEV